MSDFHELRVQEMTREAGDIYEMKLAEMKGISFDDCMLLVKSRIESKITMKWIWTDDIDAVYEAARKGFQNRYSTTLKKKQKAIS
jgi:salicylate hydroxylase